MPPLRYLAYDGERVKDDDEPYRLNLRPLDYSVERDRRYAGKRVDQETLIYRTRARLLEKLLTKESIEMKLAPAELALTASDRAAIRAFLDELPPLEK